MAKLKRVKRKKWRNHIKEVEGQPMSTWDPSQLNEIRSIVKSGYDRNIPVRAIGSGHSWSRIGLTNGFLIEPQRINLPLQLNTAVLKDGTQTKHLVEVQSGITVRQLNKYLDKNGLALPNMGGYDGQTIVGALSTSTHGSGIKHGPLCDLMKSIDIVARDGELFRIEPKNGITDPVKYKAQKNAGKLIQDDKYFDSVRVSIGCMGVIYSTILKVRDAFNLQEIRSLSDWTSIKKDLRKKDVLKNNEHYEILINPYKVNGKYECLITTRNTRTDKKKLSPKDKRRNFFPELGSALGFVTRAILNEFNNNPKNSPKLISSALKALKDNSYYNKSFKVYNIGAANDIPSYSSEIALPLKNDKYIDGIDHMLKVIDNNKKEGDLYHSGPISFRFVKSSSAYLSPQFKKDMCMVEIIMMKNTIGAMTMYKNIEKELYQFNARIHWGQINFLTAEIVNKMYPKLSDWKEVRKKLDPKGIFSNSFSDQLGL